jgi:hypothetical protein
VLASSIADNYHPSIAEADIVEMIRPFVTVLVPTFNAAATIKRAVDSAPAQTCADYETIMDDAGAIMATCGCRPVNEQGTVYGELGNPPPGIEPIEIWRSLPSANRIARSCAPRP